MTATAPESIANTYIGIDDLKARMGITGTANDSVLWATLNAASRAVERFCNRNFYAVEAVRIFDIDDPVSVPLPDLAVIVDVLEDQDGDRVFETDWPTSDYSLYPLNAEPETSHGRPYSEIRSDVGSSGARFTVGRSRLSIEGIWGFRHRLVDSGSVVSSVGGIDAVEVVVSVDAVTEIQAGMTLLIDDEQMFVQWIDGTDLTVKRGVNGTTGSAHEDSAPVSLVEYPPEVVEATGLLAARFWKSKDASSAGIAGAVGYDPIRVRSGIDFEVEALLGPLRKLPIGVGV